MLNKLLYATKYMLGRVPAGRSLWVFPDDTFIVSFPRSGNTWTRFLLSNLMHPGEAVSFENIDRFIPEISVNSKRRLNAIPRPRILKSHEYFDVRYRKVVYIVRDPRDVALSGYQFYLKRRQIDESVSLSEFVRGLLRGKYWELFGTWRENVVSWLVARWGSEGFLFLKYEDMLRRPEAETAKLAAFLGIKSDANRISQAVQRSRFEEMQKLEKIQADRWFLTKGTRKDIPFVRQGLAGGWNQVLPFESLQAIEREWGDLMQALNYSLATRQVPDSSAHWLGAQLNETVDEEGRLAPTGETAS